MNAPLSMKPIQITALVTESYREILSPEALRFVAELTQRFEPRRRELLRAREERWQRLKAGELPAFLDATREIREAKWTVANIPPALQDRRVEITGPVDRKMIINALNSGASMFMADLEDSNSPTWRNTVEGQVNLRDAVNRTISFSSPEGKEYLLQDRTSVLLVRPRGWHLVEKHALFNGASISGSLFDFGLYFFHNARQLLNSGVGPYFYLPKMESHL